MAEAEQQGMAEVEQQELVDGGEVGDGRGKAVGDGRGRANNVCSGGRANPRRPKSIQGMRSCFIPY
jgi:hypothetical protein